MKEFHCDDCKWCGQICGFRICVHEDVGTRNVAVSGSLPCSRFEKQTFFQKIKIYYAMYRMIIKFVCSMIASALVGAALSAVIYHV